MFRVYCQIDEACPMILQGLKEKLLLMHPNKYVQTGWGDVSIHSFLVYILKVDVSSTGKKKLCIERQVYVHTQTTRGRCRILSNIRNLSPACVNIEVNMVHQTASLARSRWKGLVRPMRLKWKVRVTSRNEGSNPCAQEMFKVMACWKSNGFEDSSCREELDSFVSCVQRVRSGEMQDQRTKKSQTWSPQEVNHKFREFIKNK